MYRALCTLYPVQSTMDTLPCTEHCVHCTLYRAQCTVWSQDSLEEPVLLCPAQGDHLALQPGESDCSPRLCMVHLITLHCTVMHCFALHCTALLCSAAYWAVADFTTLHYRLYCSKLFHKGTHGGGQQCHRPAQDLVHTEILCIALQLVHAPTVQCTVPRTHWTIIHCITEWTRWTIAVYTALQHVHTERLKQRALHCHLYTVNNCAECTRRGAFDSLPLFEANQLSWAGTVSSIRAMQAKREYF